MTEIQIINKILFDKSTDFLINNGLTLQHFNKRKSELSFILEHLNQYNQVPDQLTFLSKFNQFEIIEVNESEEYLAADLKEKALFTSILPILQKGGSILETDSNEALAFIKSQLDNINLTNQKSIDLIKGAKERYTNYLEKQVYKSKMFTFTGFPELDKVIQGFSQDGELAVFFARTNNGKSWVGAKVAVAAWQQKRQVGFYSGEMTADKVGYRIDTLISGISNKALARGYDTSDYSNHIDTLLESDTSIHLVTPKELGTYLTITQLENFIITNKIELMVIDQLSLMVDETSNYNTPERTKYSNLTKAIKRLSEKHKCIMVVLCQANRSGAYKKDEKGLPEIEHIAESDAVGQDATLAVSLRIKDYQLEMEIKKYRDGEVGANFVYALELDKGKFTYLANNDYEESSIQRAEEIKNNFDDGEDVF